MDLNVLIWVNNNMHSSGILNNIWKFITSTGDTGFIWIILCIIMLFNKHTRKAGVVMTLSLAMTYVMCDIVLKNIIMRARPFEKNSEFFNFINSVGYKLPDSSSFPSGHAASSFAVAYALFICDKKCGKLCLIWAILVALSRIYMCVHYPTDVFAGIMLGFIIAHVASLIVNYIQKYYCMKYMGYIKVNSMLKRRNA